MHKFYLAVGTLALLLFGYANVQGWSVFDNEAQARAPGWGGSSGRHYHK